MHLFAQFFMLLTLASNVQDKPIRIVAENSVKENIVCSIKCKYVNSNGETFERKVDDIKVSQDALGSVLRGGRCPVDAGKDATLENVESTCE
jgi:hypothetical protein